MRWTTLPLAAALAVASTRANAADSSWGVMVTDQAGDLVTLRWIDGPMSIGSAPDVELPLAELSAHHLKIEPLPKQRWRVSSPDGSPFAVDDRNTSGEHPWAPGERLQVGPYRLELLLPSDVPRSSSADPVDIGERAEAARRAEFEKTAYRFCHDPEFGKNGVVGADFCAILDEKSEDVCPEAKAHCQEWRELEGKSALGAKGARKGGTRTARRSSSPLIPRLPPVVAYVFLGVLVAGLVFWFVRSLRAAGWEKPQVHLEEVQLDAAALNLQHLPEAKSAQLLRAAERAHERGDDVEAAILLHLATLRHLDDEGLVRWHASKTNGDYLRAIRKHKPLAALFRGIANQTERVRFGDGRVEASSIPNLLEKARQLLVKGSTLPEAAGPAVLLLIGSLLGGQLACMPGDDPSKAYYEYGPSGMSALPDVLTAAGLEVKVGRDRLIDIGTDTGVVVLRTSAAANRRWPKDLSADRLLSQGTHVVVIDDLGRSPILVPVTSTTSGKPGQAVELEVRADAEVPCLANMVGLDEQAGLDPVKIPTGVRLRVNRDPKTSTVTISKADLEVTPFLIEASDRAERWDEAAAIGMVAIATDPRNDDAPYPGCLYLLSDRDLLTNASLTRAPNARFVGQLFARWAGGKKVLLLDRLDPYVTSTGDGGGDDDPPADPSRALKASNLLPFLLQAFVTLALIYVFVGAAFGRLRDPVRREHKNFVEHVEALGRHYAAAGTAGLTHAAQSLARLVVMRNRDRVRGSGAQAGGWAGLAQDLARQHQLAEEDVRSALRLGIEGQSELGAPTPNDPPPSSERMLKTLSRLLSGRSEKLALRKRRRRGRAP